MNPRPRNSSSSGSTISLFCRREHRQFPHPHLVATPSACVAVRPLGRPWTVTPHACLPRHTPSFSNPNRLHCHRVLTARYPRQIPLLRVRCRPRIRYVLARVSPSTVVVSNRSLPQMRHVFRTVDLDAEQWVSPPTPNGTGVRAYVPVCLVFSRPPYRCGTVY